MSSFDKDAIEKFKRCGQILRETREEVKPTIREGMPIIEICEKAESLVRSKGAEPAFPCNVSINEVAAHYTSPPGDASLVPERSIVKVDIGAHLDGYVTDTAFSVCFNPEYSNLVEAAEKALKVAMDNVHPEMSASKLGALIEKTIRSFSLKPISNLTGHAVGRYLVHAAPSLPNVSQVFSAKIKLGGVYAIEPFVTVSEAAGKVEDGEPVYIFRLVKPRSLKNPHAVQLQKHIETKFRTLPFAERWLRGAVRKEEYSKAFRELLTSKAVAGYPLFLEVSQKPVAQAENTVWIVKDGCEILT